MDIELIDDLKQPSDRKISNEMFEEYTNLQKKISLPLPDDESNILTYFSD